MCAERIRSNEVPNGLRNLHRTFRPANDHTRTCQLVLRAFARFHILLKLSCKLRSTRSGSCRARTFGSRRENLANRVFGFIPETRFNGFCRQTWGNTLNGLSCEPAWDTPDRFRTNSAWYASNGFCRQTWRHSLNLFVSHYCLPA